MWSIYIIIAVVDVVFLTALMGWVIRDDLAGPDDSGGPAPKHEEHQSDTPEPVDEIMQRLRDERRRQ